MTIKLICFDLDNTLWHSDPVLKKAEVVSLEWMKQNVGQVPPDTSLDDIRAIKTRLLEQDPSLVNNLTLLRKNALNHFFLTLGLTPNDARKATAGAFQAFITIRNQVQFFPGMVPLLKNLSKTYTLAALSNGNSDPDYTGVSQLFPIVENAESVGAAKPAPAMFEKALALAEAKASQAIHVGDHPVDDIETAKSLGFHTIWVNFTDKRWPTQYSDADHQVTSIVELEQAIHQICRLAR